MRRLLSVCLLMLCLSIPVFAGHTIGGGYCTPCDGTVCFCDAGEQPPSASRAVSSEPSQETPAPTDLGAEAFFILAALLLVLRYKA